MQIIRNKMNSCDSYCYLKMKTLLAYIVRICLVSSKMKPKLMLSIILICLISLNLLAKEKKPSMKWSRFQGKANWKIAKAKCKKIGMRLPSVSEVGIGFQTVRTTGFYWSSDYCSLDKTLVCVYAIDKVKGVLGFQGISGAPEKDRVNVRCVK